MEGTELSRLKGETLNFMNIENSRYKLDEITGFIHQAALNPHLSEESLDQICKIANQFNFSGLCTNLLQLANAKKRLGVKSSTKLIAVIAFPFGDIPSILKKKEAEWAAIQGADELEVVPNFLALQNGEINIFAEELAELVEFGLPIRSILDMSNLSKEKLSTAIEASIDAGVTAIQSGNGFGAAISKEQIKELSLLTKGRCLVKGVGGIKTLPHAIELIDSGADQIGTSFGWELVQQIKKKAYN